MCQWSHGRFSNCIGSSRHLTVTFYPDVRIPGDIYSGTYIALIVSGWLKHVTIMAQLLWLAESIMSFIKCLNGSKNQSCLLQKVSPYMTGTSNTVIFSETPFVTVNGPNWRVHPKKTHNVWFYPIICGVSWKTPRPHNSLVTNAVEVEKMQKWV